MPSPDSWSPFSTLSATGDVALDSLLSGSKWGTDPVGTAISLSYSFPDFKSSWSTDPITGYGPVGGTGEPRLTTYQITSESDQGYIRTALSSWANVANITFTEVPDNANIVGDIRFAYTGGDAGAQAWSYYPDNSAVAGDVWFNSFSTSATATWSLGSYEFFAVIHELGHALGLMHPFESEPPLPVAEDYWWNTVMSYSAQPEHSGWKLSYNPTTPMPLDILAIQYMYGANTTAHVGDDFYTFYQDSDYLQTIYDAGGNDTIQYIASSSGGVIDLRPDGWSQLGKGIIVSDDFDIYVKTELNTVNIYKTVTIENAIGSDFNDTIYGNDANNRLDGRGGTDTLIGGLGNDSYVVDTIGDVVTESSTLATEIDTVNSSITYTLGANVENLVLTGTVNINGIGNARNNVLTGNDQANTLNGAFGADTMMGGLGNDTYFIDNIADVVSESSTLVTEIDTVQSSSTYTLPVNVENLTLTGTKAINGAGNSQKNVLTGNALANVLEGKVALDTLKGGSGNDTLIGGAGKDDLTGGLGADVFKFNSITETGLTGLGRDVIRDFHSSAGDKIDLSLIDANKLVAGDNAFTLFNLGSAFSGVFTNRAALFFDQTTHILYGNNDIDATADFSILLLGVTTLSQTDFIL